MTHAPVEDTTDGPPTGPDTTAATGSQQGYDASAITVPELSAVVRSCSSGVCMSPSQSRPTR